MAEPATPHLLDCRGEKCPLPVLRTEKRLAQLQPGDELIVLATDPVAKVDIPLYCLQNGFACTTTSEGEALRFTISAKT